jgi:glycosyltransferase involved in cell wall biosynthesis
MKIFLSGTSFRSSYGGPARSVSRLAEALATTGAEVGLWSADGSVIDTPFLGAHSAVRRLGGSEKEALEVFGKPDIFHDNGIWLPHNHRLAALASARDLPRVVSTRGMLEPWAMNHKRWKKRLAWALYQRADLCAASCHHVTSPGEAATVRGHHCQVAVREIPNGVDLPDLSAGQSPRERERVVLFVGRIYPVKGLPMLAEAWAKVRPAGWTVKIVGPDEAGHRGEVEEILKGLKIADDFVFTGELDGPEKRDAYASASLFILPSHTENFGMAIGEALAHGLPVIATHGTPWQVIESEGCGWWCPTTAEGLAAALEPATASSAETLREMGARARALVERNFSWHQVALDFAALYRELTLARVPS